MSQHLGKQHKVIIMGDGAVNLLTQYLQNHFDANTKLTVGASVKFQQITTKQLYEEAGVKNRLVDDLNTDNIFHYWNLGGQRMFD